MNKSIWIVVVIILLSVGYFVFRGIQPTEPSTFILPEDALPLDELPEDYLAEQTAPKGSSVEEKLSLVYDELHTGNSGDYVRQNFPDLEYLLDWTPEGPARRIYPFFYYYSEEADTTFVICNINKTVAVCDGKQDTLIKSGVNDEACLLAKPFENNFI